MKIVSNNFYLVNDDFLSIVSLHVGTRSISVGNRINFFVDNEESGQKLRVITRENLFEYDIVTDENDLQQIYNLKMQPAGLVSDISTFTNPDQGITNFNDIQFLGSTELKDYDFWFSRQEFRILVPNNDAVDSIEEIYSEDLGVEVNALQNVNELVIFIEPNPLLNLSNNVSIQFKIHTNGNEYFTNKITITPGDEALSECIVTGTFFEGDQVINESRLRNQNMNIILSLRFETWVDDIQLIRSELINMVQTEVTFSASDIHFTNNRPAPQNTSGIRALLEEASITKTSEQDITITLGRSINLSHPETVTIQNISPNLIRSGIQSIPVILTNNKLVLPTPGSLEVITQNGDVISEKDLWTGTTRITLRANNDEWQDTSLLTETSLQALHDHIRNSMSSESPEWTTLVQTMDFTLTSSGSDLHIDIAQQTSDIFNISSVIEITIDVGLVTSNGLITRLSNNPFLNTTFLLIKPVQSFVSIGKAVVSESELWQSNVELTFRLVDDLFITNQETILTSLQLQFDQYFSSNQISHTFTITDFQQDSFTLLIPQATPASFNINADSIIFINFESSFLRNGTNLSSPEIHFISTQVTSTMTGTDAVTTQMVRDGFFMTIHIFNDAWITTNDEPVNLTSRSNEVNGWNRTANLTFSFVSETELQVHVQAPNYNITNIEVIDIFIQNDATYNKRIHYVDNFTVQGSSLIERNHHTHARRIQELMFYLNDLKKRIHSIKLTISPTLELGDNDTNFNAKDTIHERLRKLNSSDIEHPISVCKPPLINANKSSTIQTAVNEFLVLSQKYTISKPFPPVLCIPILCPQFDPEAADTLYSLVLSKPLALTVTKNNNTTLHLPASNIHAIAFTSVDQSLSIEGTGVKTVSFSR